MLKYEVKLNEDNIKKDELVWSEKYLSPSLSYITGVTSPNYHLEKFSTLSSTNSIINIDSILNLECYNVERQGYIIVKEKVYKVESGTTVDYSINKTGDTVEYHYIFNKGKYFYWGELENEDKSGYTFNNLSNYDKATSSFTENIKVEADKSDDTVKIDTLYWIEDGEVEIDGYKYFYDRNEGEEGILKYKENGESLEASAITECEEIEFHPYTSSAEYKEVTKFKLTKNSLQQEDFSRITFARYFYYVKYKNHYCTIKQKFDGEKFSFVCEIPLYVISAKTEDMLSNLDVNEYELYYVTEYGDDGASAHYKESYENGNKLDSDHIDEHSVHNLNDLKNATPFIFIDEEKAYFSVEHNVMNGNDGNGIIVYFNNVYAPLNVGDSILFINNTEYKHNSVIYNSEDYAGVDEEYVTFNSRKFLVEKHLLDKVLINDNEYDIDYISGRTEGVDCLVTIGNEKVPMKIVSVDDTSGTLQRYGKIVSGDSDVALDAVYDIKPYDGINVDGKKYIIYDDGEEKYAVLELPKKYTLNIIEKLGNSSYVCEPFINTTEFTDEFNKIITNEICNDIVFNQSSYSMYIQNKIFGEQEITADLPFIRKLEPTSSDDYYDLFNDLVLYTNNGYLQIPLNLCTDFGNNIIQNDLVMRDFYEAEKNKAINGIVDMEKDVYIPKYIESGVYNGSSTIFKNINEINFNLHFRTRDLNSWKVNDGGASYDTSITSDNWFITDFHPYCDILNNDILREEMGDELMRSSDLMRLLYFTNDDVFYQRSKISKSFLRLSFYDSTDQQTQSLLATSCIFFDGHKLFKKFIDNSRRNERVYGSISEPIFKRDDNGYIISPKIDIASSENLSTSIKISIDRECLGSVTNHPVYETYERDCNNITLDESTRISSRLTVNNKYDTNTSAEGFYLYIFREYSEKLHPKPIYMKAEFNHAGIGRIIPLLVPMHWTGETSNSAATNYNKMYPERRLTLSEENDLYELKAGFPLSYVYAQTYIPLYAVYDFINKEYAYVFDSRYVTPNNDGSLEFNLFELKVKDESQEEATEEELVAIKTNRQRRAIINVNTNQFNINSFNDNVG